MRCTGGYGGPVAHWWRDSLHYTGPGLDWRYEGIVTGYLNLFNQTKDDLWLQKARQAGDDLVYGQISTGNFHNSAFEINPQCGGTPHEAACDLALLQLASTMREHGYTGWQQYADCAAQNIERFILGILWDREYKFLQNTAYDPSFVPNKAATVVELLLLWSELIGDEATISTYCLPILDKIVASQIKAPNSAADGAIPQALIGSVANERYFPYYIARCIPALLQGYQISGTSRYLQSAQAAMRFILRYQQPDGAFPQVVYRHGTRINHYPQWIAGVGDILRAMTLLKSFVDPAQIESSLTWLLNGQQANGSIRTARGFASQVNQRAPVPLPDFRDLLGVCGWTDKAFRYLTSRPEARKVTPNNAPTTKFTVPCNYFGRPAIFREDDHQIEIRRGQEPLYRWQKGSNWAEVYTV